MLHVLGEWPFIFNLDNLDYARRNFLISNLNECEFEVLSQFSTSVREATIRKKFTYTPLDYDSNMP